MYAAQRRGWCVTYLHLMEMAREYIDVSEPLVHNRHFFVVKGGGDSTEQRAELDPGITPGATKEVSAA